MPEGRVVLTISGDIARTNVDGVAQLDRAMLEAIGLVEIETHTPFTEGTAVYRGVLARDLFNYLGADGDAVSAVAIDRYTIEIPMDDFTDYDVLIALDANGERLRIRNHGPAWVVYPWAQHAELNKAAYHSRSIWQLVSLDVR